MTYKVNMYFEAAQIMNGLLRVSMQPFIDADQSILQIFPDPYYALAPPAFLGVLLMGVTLVTIGCFLVHGELSKLHKTKSD